MTKEEIRKMMRMEAAARCADGDMCQRQASVLWSEIERLPEFAAARTVLAFMAMKDEVPTREFIEKWSGSKRIAIPLVISEGVLELKEFRPDCLKEGYKGILEPTEDAPSVAAEEIDIALVPGMAFDRQGHRLGRGKGFYDRLLPRLKCKSVAICQPWRIISQVPVDGNDIPVSIVPTINDPATKF